MRKSFIMPELLPPRDLRACIKLWLKSYHQKPHNSTYALSQSRTNAGVQYDLTAIVDAAIKPIQHLMLKFKWQQKLKILTEFDLLKMALNRRKQCDKSSFAILCRLGFVWRILLLRPVDGALPKLFNLGYRLATNLEEVLLADECAANQWLGFSVPKRGRNILNKQNAVQAQYQSMAYCDFIFSESMVNPGRGVSVIKLD